MSSNANKTPPPPVIAEWQKLCADLKRTQAQLKGQLRRLESLMTQATEIVVMLERGESQLEDIEEE